MFILNKSLSVIEYTSSSVTVGNTPVVSTVNPHVDLKINSVRLAIAIAKCIFTRDPGGVDAIFESSETFLRIQRMVDAGLQKNLRLRASYFDNLRDFSGGTRTGELAQGINFLMAQDNLYIPILVDYHGYCTSKGFNSPPKSTPDFMACSKSGSYILLESKGTLSKSSPPATSLITSRLRKALEQCDEGEAYLMLEGQPAASQKFGALASFQYSSSTIGSQIFICDPEAPNKNNSFDTLSFIRYYYESIFRGFSVDWEWGYFTRRAQQVGANTIREHKGIKFISVTPSMENPLFPDLYNFPKELPEYLEFGVSIDVLRALEFGDIEGYFKAIKSVTEAISIQDNELNTKIVTEAEKHSEIELFVDGTITWSIW